MFKMDLEGLANLFKTLAIVFFVLFILYNIVGLTVWYGYCFDIDKVVDRYRFGNIKGGWYCDFDAHTNIVPPFIWENYFLETYCDGEYFIHPTKNYVECAKSFSDAGKVCRDNSECSGEYCIECRGYICKPDGDGKGQCIDYPTRCNSYFKYLVNGGAHQYDSICIY